MIFGSAYHEGFESVLAGDAAEEGPELGLHLRRDQIASVFGGEDAMDEFRDIGVGHGRLRGESSAVPSGTEFQHPLSYPALKRRAIVRRPPDAFSFPERSAGSSSSSCHPVAIIEVAIMRAAVGIAQLAEHRTVAPTVAGSIPVSHPRIFLIHLRRRFWSASPSASPSASLGALAKRGFGETGQVLEAAVPTQSVLQSPFHIGKRLMRCVFFFLSGR